MLTLSVDFSLSAISDTGAFPNGLANSVRKFHRLYLPAKKPQKKLII